MWAFCDIKNIILYYWYNVFAQSFLLPGTQSSLLKCIFADSLVGVSDEKKCSEVFLGTFEFSDFVKVLCAKAGNVALELRCRGSRGCRVRESLQCARTWPWAVIRLPGFWTIVFQAGPATGPSLSLCTCSIFSFELRKIFSRVHAPSSGHFSVAYLVFRKKRLLLFDFRIFVLWTSGGRKV